MQRNSPLFDNPDTRDFRENNSRILQNINLLQHRYACLLSLRRAHLELDEDIFLKSVNFLQQTGYIEIRSIDTRQDVLLPDAKYTDLEARVSQKGSRLLGGELFDKMIGGYDGK